MTPEVSILKGKNNERPKASAATLNKIYLCTDINSVKIGIALSNKEYGWYDVGTGTIYADDVIYDGSAWPTPVSNVEEALNYLYSNSGGSPSGGAFIDLGERFSGDALIDAGPRF